MTDKIQTKEIRLQLEDDKPPVILTVPKDASAEEIYRLAQSEKLKRQSVPVENTQISNVDKIVSRLPYDPSNVENELAQDALSAVQGIGLDLPGTVVDPSISAITGLRNFTENLNKRLDGGLEASSLYNALQTLPKNPVYTSDIANAIYQPKDEDKLRNRVIRSLMSFGGLFGLGSKLKSAVDKPIETSVRRFATDDPATNALISATVPATSYLATEKTGNPVVGDVFGIGSGILGTMFGKPILDRTPIVKDINLNPPQKSQKFDLESVAEDAKIKLDNAKQLSDEAYKKADFTGLRYDNMTSNNIINDALNEINLDIDRKLVSNENPYRQAENLLKNYKSKFSSSSAEKMTLNELDFLKSELDNLYTSSLSDKSVTPAMKNKILKAKDLVDDALKDESIPIFGYSPDGVLLPNDQAISMKKQADSFYRQKSYLDNVTNIIDDIRGAVARNENITTDQIKKLVKDKIYQTYKSNTKKAKQNFRYLTAQQKDNIDKIYNSKTPYKDALDVLSKSTNDLRTFMTALVSSPITAVSVMGLGNRFQKLKDRANEQMIMDLVQSFTSPAIREDFLTNKSFLNVTPSNLLNIQRNIDEEERRKFTP
tara:strand:- start:1422 stop:3221 length:1800 start_codon:yes stop_codon:yes gene_type:complete